MKRSAPLKRTRLRPVSKTVPSHRDVLPPEERREFVSRLVAAYGWRCAVCRKARTLDLHHVIKRSQAGADGWSNELPLCSLVYGPESCHARTDEVYAKGRLRIEPLGARRFRWAVVTKPDKWAEDPPGVVWTEVGPEEER